MTRVLRLARARTDLLVLAAILVAIQLFPRQMPGGLYGIGMVHGAQLALLAVGIILIYRSNGIINFAQIQVGSLGAVLFVGLVQYSPLLRGLALACPPCAGADWLAAANYWVSLALSLGFAVLLSYAIYVLIIKRFAGAPRLVLSIATVFIAELLAGVQGAVPDWLSRIGQTTQAPLQSNRTPLDISFSWDPAQFHLPDIAMVVVAALAVAGVLLHLRFSRSGLAMRAAADRPVRAETIGVDVLALTGRAWIIAGGLSGAAAIIAAMAIAPSEGSPLDAGLLVEILAVAVIARMSSLWVTGIAALVIGVLSVALVWSFHTTVILSAVLLLVIAAVLLLQTRAAYRRDSDDAGVWRLPGDVREIPAALRELTVVRVSARVGGLLLVAAAIGSPWALSAAQVSLAAVVVIYAMIGYSLLILTGWGGQISLGQFALAAAGGYAAASLRLPFPLALLAGGLAGALVAVLIGLPALRLRGVHLAVTTIAFAVAVPAVLLDRSYLGAHLPTSLERPSVLGLDFNDNRVYFYFCLLILGLVAAGVVGMRRSRVARVLLAARDNPTAAQTFGINLVRVRLATFAVSGFIAALAGALLAFDQYGVRVATYGPEQSIAMLSLAVIGGMGSVWGPLLGALYFGVLIFTSASQITSLLATGAGGLLLLLFMQGGLSQAAFRVRDSMLRRLARRRGIEAPALGVTAADRQRAPIFPKLGPGGHRAFVPERYRLPAQWALPTGDRPDQSDG